MPNVIGEAVITVGADASGFNRDLSSETSATAKSSGNKFTSVMGGVLSKGAKVAGAGVAAALGTALVKGFSRLKAIDDARAKLTGLGHSGREVEGIMDDALKSVEGTAFGLGDAASQAATLVAAGVKPGKDLQASLKLVADTATIAGTSMGDMGSIFGKVAANGKANLEVVQQLQDRGIPALQFLAKEYGVTSAKASKMLSDGKVTFADFQSAMQKGLGGAAQESGKTFSGGLANVGAALSRFGAGVLGSVFAKMPALFGKAIAGIDKLTPVATAFGEKLGTALSRVVGWIAKIDFGKIATKLAPVAAAAVQFGKDLGSAARIAAPALQDVWTFLQPILVALGSAALGVLVLAFKTLGPVVRGVATAFAAIVKWIKENQTAATIIAGVLTAMLIPALIAWGVQSTISAAKSVAAWVATKVEAIVSGAINVANLTMMTLGWIKAGVQAMLSAARIAAAWLIALGPIGLIIAGVIAVIAIITLLWKKSDTFKRIVTGAWNAVKDAAGKVADFFTKTIPEKFSAGMKKVKGFIQGGLDWVKSHWKLIIAILAGPIGLAVLAIAKNWDKIKAGLSRAWGAIKSVASNAVSGLKTVITNGVSTIVTFITGIPGKISRLASDFLSAGKDLGGKVIEGIGNGLSAAGGFISDIGSSVKSAINDALHLPVSIHGPGPLPDFEIPAFAQGTSWAPGGAALVGERGPEVVWLPRGAGVSSAADTRAMQRGSNVRELPRKVILRIGARDFVAYVEEVADSRIDAADQLAWQGA